MKPTTINVQITKSPKQFEAVRLGMEATIDAGETVESAIKAATAQLNALYAEMYAPSAKPAQNAEKAAKASETKEQGKPATKERLLFGDPRVQQIVKRMEKTPEKSQEIYIKSLEYYEPEDKVLQVLRLAAKLA